ncbi:hypothetical protein Cni_G23744 [Canna indica]|uniref:Uncharacterized protein n=1 Tax=Canna indica TaxID=4628 RepID=A0AAQ3KXR8_9LILI|nr:hypothetical protein Cni_G23744 [Canna indica]
MAGLSFCDDGVAIDPLLMPGCSSSHALADGEEGDKQEAKEVIRGFFFHRIPSGAALSSRPTTPEFHQFFPAPSPESRLPDAVDPSSFPADDRRVYDEVVGVSGERIASCKGEEGLDVDESPPGSRRMARAELEVVLSWLRGTAIDPRDRTRTVAKEEWLETQALRARETLFRTLDDATKKSEFPVPPPPEKKQKAGKISSEGSQKKNGGKLGCVGMLNQPKRRSERIAQNANENIGHLRTRRKRIGLGPIFQADVPDWTCAPSETDLSIYKEDPDTLRWLGLKIWPAEESNDMKVSKDVIGEGRLNCCDCFSPGSIVCIRSHVSEARLKLKVDLGQAFFHWGFDDMGEEVSKLWTNEEQIRFDALKRLDNESGYRTFWQTAPTYFSSKRRRDLISYYFNVFLLRRISNQSILTPEYINSDEDDHDEDDENNEEAKKTRRVTIKKRAKVAMNHSPGFPDVNRVN